MRQQRAALINSRRSTMRASGGATLATSTLAEYPGLGLRPTLPTGDVPQAVVTGDFNKDSKMDFAVSNGADNTVWVFLGNGDGSFQVPLVVPMTQGLAPDMMVAADLRGNGTLDLVVGNFDSDTVGVLLGNGDGTFSYEYSYDLPFPPSAITVGDANGDGHPDVFVALFTYEYPDVTAQLSILIGDGTGQLSPAVNRMLPNTNLWNIPWSIEAHDLNGDGRADLVISPMAITVNGQLTADTAVFMDAGNQNYSFSGNSIFLNPSESRLVDVNGDGCVDLVSSTFFGTVTVNPGDCSGRFGATKSVIVGILPQNLILSDVDGDGNLDAVVGALDCASYQSTAESCTENVIGILPGDGKGNFAPARFYRGTGPMRAIAVADFDADGRVDLVSISPDANQVTVYLNDNNGGFGDPQGLFVGWTSAWSNSLIINVPDASAAPTLQDLNGDGKKDLLYLTNNDGTGFDFGVALNDGTGKFAFPTFYRTGLSPIEYAGDYRVADVRGTGRFDVVLTPLVGSFLELVPNIGNGTFGQPVRSSVNAQGAFGVGDFNNDGFTDVITGTQAFLGAPDGVFRPGSLLSGSSNLPTPSRVYIRDLNQDGKLDAVMWSSTANQSWVYLGNGDGTFQPAKIVFDSIFGFAMRDLNGDNLADIISYGNALYPDPSYQVTTVYTAFAKGDGTFQPLTAIDPNYLGHSISTVSPFIRKGPVDGSSLSPDLNGDGHPDIIAFQSVPGALFYSFAQLVANRGDGTLQPTYDIFELPGHSVPMFAADLDGDGREDLIDWNSLNSSMTVVKGKRAPSLQIALEKKVFETSSGRGWVFLNVPASGTTVALSTSVQGITLPSSVSIPDGAISAEFDFTFDQGFDPTRAFDVKAQLGSDTATAIATHADHTGFSMTTSGPMQQAVNGTQSTAAITITLSSIDGYSSVVDLSCKGLPDYAGGCVFTPAQVTVPANGSATATLVINTKNLFYWFGDISVRASDHVHAQYATMSLKEAALSVTIFTSDSAYSPGAAHFTLVTNGIAPFQYNCSGLPSGATCDYASTILTVTVPAGVDPGSYPFTISVASNGLTSNTSAILNINPPPNFSITPLTTQDLWAPIGGTTTRNLALQGSTNFSATITITCSTSWGGACSATPVKLVGPVSGNSTLTLDVPAGTPRGSASITVVATGGGYTNSMTKAFSIADVDVVLTSSQLTMTGGTASTTLNLSASTGFVGSMTFSCDSPAFSCAFAPASVNLYSGAQNVPVVITLRRTQSARNSSGAIPLSLVCLTLPLIFVGARSRKTNRVMGALISCVLLGTISCGGGGGNSIPTPTPPPPATYAVKIIGTIAQSTATKNVTINVTGN